MNKFDKRPPIFFLFFYHAHECLKTVTVQYRSKARIDAKLIACTSSRTREDRNAESSRYITRMQKAHAAT